MMRNELPQEIQALIGRCEINEVNFDNDDMSAALACVEEFHQRIAKLEALLEADKILAGGLQSRIAKLEEAARQVVRRDYPMIPSDEDRAAMKQLCDVLNNPTTLKDGE